MKAAREVVLLLVLLVVSFQPHHQQQRPHHPINKAEHSDLNVRKHTNHSQNSKIV